MNVIIIHPSRMGFFLTLLFLFSTQNAYAGLTATASSEEKAECQASNAVDGDLNTRWSSSFDDGQWLQIDLGVTASIEALDIYWEAAYARQYDVLVSEDGESWNKVFTESEGDGSSDEITFPKQPARFIKIDCQKRGTEWGNSIYEVAVKGVHEVVQETISDPDSRRSPDLIAEDPLVLEWLKQIQDASTPDRQLVSAMEDAQLQTFNNSLVAIVFILKGERERAERILDFYSGATDPANDVADRQNFFYKGEARGFFQSAMYERRHGAAGYFEMGTNDRWMGDMAWLLTAYKYYEKEFGPERYEKIAGLLKNLLVSWFKDEGSAGYVQHGWRHGDEKLHEPFGHHEGNIDAYAVMKLCGEEDIARKIRKWLDRSIQGADLPLDLYTWRVLAYGPKYAYLLNIPDHDPRFRKTLKINGAAVTGFYHGPDAAASNIWLDGTGHMACAYITCGDKQRGYFYSNQMDAFLLDRTIGGKLTRALPYTANKQNYEWVDTSRGFVSAVAWYIFAKNSFDPLTLTKYEDTTPRIPNPQPPYRGAASETVDPFADVQTWQMMADKKTQMTVRKSDVEIVIDYAFNDGSWALVRKGADVWNRLLDKTISFELKADGPANTLELKFLTANETVFGWRADLVSRPDYSRYAVKFRDFKYWWGADKSLAGVKAFDIAISKSGGGAGHIHIRNLRIE